MRVGHLLAWALPLGCMVDAATTKKSTTTTSKKSATTTTKKSTTSSTTTPPAAAKSALCSVLGAVNNAVGPFTTIGGSPGVSAAQCQLFCQQAPGCLSFAISGGKCYLFKNKAASEYVKATQGVVYSFFDAACSVPTTAATGSSGTPSTNTPAHLTNPTTPLPNLAATQVAQTFPAITSPGTLSGDSPSLSSSSVNFPTDDSFTATYSYEDIPLPSIIAMGSSPNTDGLAAPSPTQSLPCVVDPASGAQFTLANPSFWPIISKSGAFLGSLPTPTSQAQASALGFPGPLQAPQYFFVAVAGAPAGVYDLVLAGKTPQYVALTSSGLVMLTSSSTGTNPVTRNGISMTTSIFGVDCFGRILVSQGGSSYTWSVTGDYTQITKGAPSSYFYAIPPGPAPSSRKRARRQARKRSSTSGGAPRCPNSPPGLISNLKPSHPNLNEQGCGWLQTGLYSVISYDFTDDCNALDECYGNCASKSFEQCNDDFVDNVSLYTCDVMAISTDIEDWLLSSGCTAQLFHWRSVIRGDKGRQHFESINSDQCSCYCPGTNSLCPAGTSGAYNCVNLMGGEQGNCGACGRTCSGTGVCKSGSCACPHDKCGDRCVDLHTHKDNCGACGNKCDSGYCIGGQCYTPKADRCNAALTGFQNPDFANGLTNWAVTSNDSAPYVHWDTSDGLVLSMKLTKDYGTASIYVNAKVPICPGMQYTFNYQMKHVSGTAFCYTHFNIPGDEWVPYVSSDTGTTFATYGPRTEGPFTVGNTGVTKGDTVGAKGATMDFEMDLECEWGSSYTQDQMEVHFVGMSLVPVLS